MKISNSDHSVDVTPEDMRCLMGDGGGASHWLQTEWGHPAPVPCCWLAEMMRRFTVCHMGGNHVTVDRWRQVGGVTESVLEEEAGVMETEEAG